MKKRRKKAWHDRHIRKNSFEIGEQVLLYDCKFQKFSGKLQINYLGSFIVMEIKYFGEVRLMKLDGVLLHGWLNGACLKPFYNT